MAQPQKKPAQQSKPAPQAQGTKAAPSMYGGQGSDKKSLIDVGVPPTAEQVADFHTNSDVDTRKESQHHTLGIAPYQASPGDHTHDGGTSPLLLAGTTITGVRGTPAWASSVNALLVKLGAIDSSTSA